MANSPRDAEAASILDLISRRAELAPGAIAIGAPGRVPLDYAGLVAHVEAVGSSLRRLGIGRADRVAIVLGNGPNLATAFLGVASFATAAPLNPAYRDPEFDFFLGDLRPKALIVERGVASPCRTVASRLGVRIVELDAPSGAPAGRFSLEVQPSGSASADPPSDADDVALVLHTSGTTSRPKMVPLSHRNLAASATNIAATLALTAADRALNVMPLYHIHGLVAATLASLAAGASVSCTSGFDPARFFAWYDEVRPTWYTAVPTMHQAVLAAAPANAALIASHRLRFARSSSAAMPPSLIAALEAALGAPLLEAYGMTEASHQMASNPLPPRPRKPGSVGVATGVEIAILDAAGDHLGKNRRGEIAIRGPSVTPGYLENPKANESAFTHGFFRTGDEGTIDDDGYLTISGRLKEIINKAGEKISPREIDEVVIQHPAVHQVTTFALPHPTLGEDVGAAVVAKAGATVDAAELRRFCAARLAEFKVPQRFLIVAELPKGPTGKLKRVGLAEHFAAELAAPEHVAPRDDVEATLARAFAEELKLDRVGVLDNYFVLGGDSLQAVMLAARAKAFGVAFSPSQLFANPTIAELAAALRGAPSGTTTRAADRERDAASIEAVARTTEIAREMIDDAFAALPFAHGIVARYEPRLSPSALVTSWTIEGALDPARLRRAFGEVVATHPALRSGFARGPDGATLQFIARAAEVDFAFHDLEGRPEGAAADLVAAAHRAPFDLERPPLFRVLLLRERSDRHRLACFWLHAIVDLWSIGVVERAVLAAYDGIAPSFDEATPFAAFARAAARQTSAAEQRDFWRGELDGIDHAKLLRFFRGPDGFRMPSGERRTAVRRLDAARLEDLAGWAQRNALTTSTVLHGAWALVQAHHLDVDDVLFGSVVSGRWGDVARIETVVGATMEVVPVRARLAPGDEIVPWLRALQARLAEVQRFAHTPWETIAASFAPPRRNVPTWSTLVVENLPAELWERPSRSLRVGGFEHATHMVPPLLLSFFPVPAAHLKATFDPSLVGADEAERLLDAMTVVLGEVQSRDATIATVSAALRPAARRWAAT